MKNTIKIFREYLKNLYVADVVSYFLISLIAVFLITIAANNNFDRYVYVVCFTTLTMLFFVGRERLKLEGTDDDSKGTGRDVATVKVRSFIITGMAIIVGASIGFLLIKLSVNTFMAMWALGLIGLMLGIGIVYLRCKDDEET